MKLRILSFTSAGAALSIRLRELLAGENDLESLCYAKKGVSGVAIWPSDVRAFAQKAFETGDALVFIGAAGIAVRAIAPFVRSKAEDPPVLVIDEQGHYIIPLLSGHLGGANRLAVKIADKLGAAAVVTTATDLNRAFAVDVWARDNGCAIYDLPSIKRISSAVLAGEAVGFVSDFPVDGQLPAGIASVSDGETGICISLDVRKQPFVHTLHLVPRCLVVGIGCRKATDADVLEQQVLAVLEEHHLPVCALLCAATIELKAEEEALLRFCRKYRLPLRVYSADVLQKVAGTFSASAFVRRTTGVDNVCERAAVKASGGTLAVRKCAGNGVTVAVAQAPWRGNFGNSTGRQEEKV